MKTYGRKNNKDNGRVAALRRFETELDQRLEFIVETVTKLEQSIDIVAGAELPDEYKVTLYEMYAAQVDELLEEASKLQRELTLAH